MRTPTKYKALQFCANGCGVPPKAPSLVICGGCYDRLSSHVEAVAQRWAGKQRSKAQ